MRGAFGAIIGVVIVAVGLAGLGVALNEMMTHADPHTTIKAVGGLGVFVAMGLLTAILAN
jgi:hypothetical protein